MVTTQSLISEWFDRGIRDQYRFMIVICDTFDYEDYPVFVKTAEECMAKYKEPGSMQKVMEVYDLAADKQQQINMERCLNLPK